MIFICQLGSIVGAAAAILIATQTVAEEIPRCADVASPVGAQTPQTIQFLSVTDDAYRYLEVLQEVAYRDNPRVTRWTDSPEQLQKLKALLKELDTRSPARKD